MAREPLWDFLMDVPKVAKSLPGVESVSKIDDTTYEGALTVRVGPIKLNLQGKIILEEQNKNDWRAALRAEAKDRMSAASVGESKPLVDQDAQWARAVNRRVEFQVQGAR